MSRRGRSIRVPFTNVPFVEPRSCTQTPSRRGSKRACRADANSSPSSGTSFCPPRPMVSGAESSSTLVPSASAGLLTTTRRPVWIAGCRAPSPSTSPGRRMKLSCGSRTSRLALRTIRQMNR
jgi:hypothetical protein